MVLQLRADRNLRNLIRFFTLYKSYFCSFIGQQPHFHLECRLRSCLEAWALLH